MGDLVLVEMKTDSTDIINRRYLRGRVRKLPANETHEHNFFKVGLLTEPEVLVGRTEMRPDYIFISDRASI